MRLNEAVSQVLNDYPEMESHKLDWQFFRKVLSLMSYDMKIEIAKGIPSPDSIMREWRRQKKEKEKAQQQEKKKGNEIIVDYHLTKSMNPYTIEGSQFL